MSASFNLAAGNLRGHFFASATSGTYAKNTDDIGNASADDDVHERRETTKMAA